MPNTIGETPARRTAGTAVLREAVLTAAHTSEEAEARGDNGFGEVYLLRFRVTTAVGSAMVLSACVYRSSRGRLSTPYELLYYLSL